MFYYTFKKLLFNKSYFVFMSDKNAADFNMSIKNILP